MKSAPREKQKRASRDESNPKPGIADIKYSLLIAHGQKLFCMESSCIMITYLISRALNGISTWGIK